ncbi:hypothetical protein Poli38472_011133 [Pythium oligandrum]|uniref:ABC transporter domain-containing protein n=1 Tax=Pythium oligandrum TaxID=41045 RepID=A0A8K1FRE7_PYTOL|nr:hypothetical protein Poli38472_011133 [Pythium oligandrum]|eukprot:TMW67513.1 hypothetical protein Poli38472_011133 [Pythium oligandrum]
MEVRFQNLTLSAELEYSNNPETIKVPSVASALKSIAKSFAPTKRTATKYILKDVSGVFKPGTMTLIRGQPGSGKSSLMKILSGRFPMAKNIKMEGEITYNGVPHPAIIKRLPQYVLYVTQRDNHFPTLSVKETLEFAHEWCGGELSEREKKRFNQGSPEENQAALEAARALHRHYPEVVIQQLGLENCQDTVVAMLRGVSGGERKRVTTGEMAFGNKYVTLMDEISTGLDSAATYDIIKTQRSIAKKLCKTVVIALLQPSPEVFHLFDDVMILNKGRVMYHGPCEQVTTYFEDLVFHCPPKRDVADFLMDLGTHRQAQYERNDSILPSPLRYAHGFAEAFANSDIYKAMLKNLHGPHDSVLLQDKEEVVDHIPEFHQSFLESTWALLRRQMKFTLRNTAFIKARALLVLVVSFFYGSVFWNVDPNDAQV